MNLIKLTVFLMCIAILGYLFYCSLSNGVKLYCWSIYLFTLCKNTYCVILVLIYLVCQVHVDFWIFTSSLVIRISIWFRYRFVSRNRLLIGVLGKNDYELILDIIESFGDVESVELSNLNCRSFAISSIWFKNMLDSHTLRNIIASLFLILCNFLHKICIQLHKAPI